MKINPVSQAASFLRLVQSKGDGPAGGDSQGGRQRENRDAFSRKNSEDLKLSDEALKKAVESALSDFEADPQTQANQLSAAIQGRGVDLRVILKDAQGMVLRQFTGEEFIRLRKASQLDHRLRGRLLDQKL